jgi:hypothetical protein
MTPINEARSYIRQGIAGYEYGRLKHDAKVWLELGNLDRAIRCTQVCLFIGRIQKFTN